MSQIPNFGGYLNIPGQNAVLEGVENQPWFGRPEQQIWLSEVISSAALDAGNTVTTLLRNGLLLGRVTSTGELKEWNPTGTDGSEIIVGVLGGMLSTQMNGAGVDKFVGFVQVGGNLYSDRIIIPGNAAEGIVGDALEFEVYNQLATRFFLDRHYHYGLPAAYRPRYLTAAEITADAVTVTTADHNRTFDMVSADGTTTVTLPAAKVGLRFTVVSRAAQTTTIALASGTLVIPGNAAATGVSLTTGESATFIGVAAGVYYMMGQEATD